MPSYRDAPSGSFSRGLTARGPAPRYSEGGVLGQGARSRVTVARDERLDRDVARKTLTDLGPVARARFEREIRITASLDHPGVVPIYDAGTDDDGRPYYTMRLVRGRSLAEELATRSTLDERLAWLPSLRDVAAALAYAHDRDVVHRDIKPANIMVGPHGEAQIIDWGLATRPSDPEDPVWSQSMTQHGEVLGTPSYMPPEQAMGAVVDPRADVWSLGAILFELLTGRPPYEGHNASVILHATLNQPLPASDQWNPEAPPALCAIAQRALSRDPAGRYPDAGAFLEDLEAFLEDREVSALASTPWARLRRVVWAHRWGLGLAGSALCAVAAVGLWSWTLVSADRDRALRAETDARRSLVELRAAQAESLVSHARARMEAGARADAEIFAARSLLLADSPLARGVLAGFAAAPAWEHQRTVSVPMCRHAELRPDGLALVCLTPVAIEVWDLAPAERRWRLDRAAESVAWIGRDHLGVLDGDTRSVVRAASGALLRTSRLPGAPPGGTLRSDPAGRWMVERIDGNRAVLYDVDTLEPVEVFAGSPRQFGVATRADGAVAATIGRRLRWGGPGGLQDGPEGTAESWEGLLTARAYHSVDASGRLRVFELGGSEPVSAPLDLSVGLPARMAESPDGELVAVIGERAGVVLVTADGGRILERLPATAARDVRFAPTGELVVLEEGRVEVWAPPERMVRAAVHFEHGVSAVAVCPEGRRAAAALGGGQLAVIDLSNGEAVLHRTVVEPSGVLKTVGFLGPDRLLVSGATPASVLSVNLGDGSAERIDVPPYRRVARVREALVGAGFGPSVVDVFDLSGRKVAPRWLPGPPFADLREAPETDSIALLDVEGGVWLARVTAAEHTLEEQFQAPEASCVALSGEGERFALCRPGSLDLVDRVGNHVRRLPTPHARPLDAAFAPGAGWIAAGDTQGRVWVWAADGTLAALIPGASERISSVAFTPDGSRLIAGSWDGGVRTYDLGLLRVPAQALGRRVLARWGAAEP